MQTIKCVKKYQLPWGDSPESFVEAFKRIKLRMEHSGFLNPTCELCLDGTIEVTYEREMRKATFVDSVEFSGTMPLKHIFDKVSKKLEKAKIQGFENVICAFMYSTNESHAGVFTLRMHEEKFV